MAEFQSTRGASQYLNYMCYCDAIQLDVLLFRLMVSSLGQLVVIYRFCGSTGFFQVDIVTIKTSWLKPTVLCETVRIRGRREERGPLLELNVCMRQFCCCVAEYQQGHCVKSIQIRSFFSSVFSPNAGNTNQKKLCIWTLFASWDIGRVVSRLEKCLEQCLDKGVF